MGDRREKIRTMGAARASRRRLGRPPATDSADTRHAILRAACSCFAEFGYAATTNRAIAERAGVTAGAIYHYFESKSQLFGAATAEVSDRIFGEFARVLLDSPHFIDRLHALLDVAVRLHRDDPTLARFSTAYTLEIIRHEELLETIPASLPNDALSFFRRMAQDGIDAGELNVSPDAADDVANMLVAVTSGLASLASHDRDLANHQAATQLVGQLFDGDLVTPAASSSLDRQS